MTPPLPITFAIASIRAECASLRELSLTDTDVLERIERLCDEIERAAGTTTEPEPVKSPEKPEACKCGSTDVTFGSDPYASEIHDDHTPVWMCDACRHESLMDI